MIPKVDFSGGSLRRHVSYTSVLPAKADILRHKGNQPLAGKTDNELTARAKGLFIESGLHFGTLRMIYGRGFLVLRMAFSPFSSHISCHP